MPTATELQKQKPTDLEYKKRETNKGVRGDTLDSASIRSAGAEDPECHNLEPRIHLIDDLSKENFKVHRSQPMRVG